MNPSLCNPALGPYIFVVAWRPKQRQYLDQISRQSIKKMLRYFSLDQVSEQTNISTAVAKEHVENNKRNDNDGAYVCFFCSACG